VAVAVLLWPAVRFAAELPLTIVRLALRDDAN
jgi:hypothetical protein